MEWLDYIEEEFPTLVVQVRHDFLKQIDMAGIPSRENLKIKKKEQNTRRMRMKSVYN